MDRLPLNLTEPELPAPVAPIVASPVVAPKVAAPAPAAAAKAPAPATKPGAPAPAAAAPEVAAADAIVWTGKVDGKELKLTQAQLDRFASKGAFADKVTQEAKEAIKRAQAAEAKYRADEEARRSRAKTNTEEWLKEHGIDPEEYARQILERKVNEGKMTPEQRRAAELEAENKRLKLEQENIANAQKKQQAEQLQQHLQKRIETELVNAAKRAGMGLGDESFFAIYKSFEEAYNLGLLPTDMNGLTPAIADRIVEDAQLRIENEGKSIRTRVLTMKGQALEDFLGKEAADHIVANRLEMIRAAKGIAAQPTNGKPAPAAQQGKAKPTYLTPAQADEAMKQLGGR